MKTPKNNRTSDERALLAMSQDVMHAQKRTIAALRLALRQCVRSINVMPRTKQVEDMQCQCGMLSATNSAEKALASKGGAR